MCKGYHGVRDVAKLLQRKGTIGEVLPMEEIGQLRPDDVLWIGSPNNPHSTWKSLRMLRSSRAHAASARYAQANAPCLVTTQGRRALMPSASAQARRRLDLRAAAAAATPVPRC